MGRASGIMAAIALVAALPAAGSISVAYNPRAPILLVDARGYAEVRWTEGGKRQTLLVPPSGRVLPGGRISGADVSRAANDVRIPFARVVRRTPDGRLWAIQTWQVEANGRVELHVARWKGEPTKVEAEVEGEHLIGQATFAGKGIHGFSPTTAGKQIRHYAWIDCFRCGGSTGWKRVLGVRLAGPGGTFRLLLRPAWRAERYRVTVAGPNRGWTYAPDASVVVPAK